MSNEERWVTLEKRLDKAVKESVEEVIRNTEALIKGWRDADAKNRTDRAGRRKGSRSVVP